MLQWDAPLVSFTSKPSASEEGLYVLVGIREMVCPREEPA